MKLLKKILQGFTRIMKGQMGYTLIEVTAVVAVTATLTAVALPVAVDKVREGRLTSARDDTIKIATAIGGFYKDVGYWPAVKDASGGTLTYDVDVLISGNDSADNPDFDSATTYWDFTNSDYLQDQLVSDVADYVTGGFNWKGPYIESLDKKVDPWGHNYVVWVKGMHTPTSGASKEYGWILSAGPNGKLDTDIRDGELKGDDIGLSLYSEHGQQ